MTSNAPVDTSRYRSGSSTGLKVKYKKGINTMHMYAVKGKHGRNSLHMGGMANKGL